MDLDTRLWREASVSADVEVFLDHVGAQLLDDLRVEALAVRSIDGEGHRLETIAWMRRGAVGVSRPPSPRTELRDTAAARLRAWVRAGEIERGDHHVASAVARDLLRGLGELDDGAWTFVPLAAHAEVLGALVVLADAGSRALDRRRLAAASEALAVVLAKDHAKREVSRLREAAEAERAAALARLHVRDIGLAVIGAETGLRDVMRQVEQVAPTDTPVLIFGETGSGKEVVARAIHERSDRANGPILRVNCGAIPPELVDSELFGHERGSFTGAVAQRSGWFERADGGTLFLDEIAELPLAAQVRLLRVLQDGEFERVGGARPLQVDVRVVAATHRDLDAMARRGTFRADLWYRINTFTITLPPLRERQADIPALAAHFAERAARRVGALALPLHDDDLVQLRAYDWPGNVRELAAVIERAAILGDGRRLDIRRALGGTGTGTAPSAAPGGAFPTLDAAIRGHIERALAHCRGRIDGPRGAARMLAVNANTLRSKMQRLGIDANRFRPA
jgi:transcriptional regulator with GAF, ATPase, and Fis domain